MQRDQGFTGSHWTPPSGNYLLHIAPAAARATINTTIMEHVPTLLAVLMVIAMRLPLNATIGRALLFRTFHHEKELQLTFWPLITKGV